MLKNGASIEFIKQCTGLSEIEIKKLKDESKNISETLNCSNKKFKK